MVVSIQLLSVAAAKPAVIGQEDLADKFLISPITNEKIPAHKVQEHMRIGQSLLLLLLA